MATSRAIQTSTDVVQGARNPFRLSSQSIRLLEQYIKRILQRHNNFNDLRNKMENIDRAYFRYQTEDDKDAGKLTAGVELDNIVIPVLISQVDSFVGYCADVWLSGYPMFPIVSTPSNIKQAEMLESIIDTHSVIGQYARHLLMSFKDGIKYDFMPLEVSWSTYDRYNSVKDYLKPTEAAKLQKSTSGFTKIERMCPYNTVWDMSVPPACVAYDGEYIGHIFNMTRMPLKRFINESSITGELYNITEISKMGLQMGDRYYKDPPVVNSMVNRIVRKNLQDQDWAQWMGFPSFDDKKVRLNGYSYEIAKMYLRIVPSEWGIERVPSANSPQIWCFYLVNGTYILRAYKVYSVFDSFPMMIGQPLEDGFGIQTQSIAEAQMPIQKAASTMFDIRFNSARRAVSDRAIFDEELVSADDVNSPIAAPKIPVRLPGLNMGGKKLSDAYIQIPFDSRGTDGVIQDAYKILELADQLSGQNKPFRGQFQKGNKSRDEWRDTMGNADNRLRLPALMMECQIFVPMKESIKLGIFQNGVLGNFQHFKSGTPYEITATSFEELRKNVLNFRVADGYTPASKLASTDAIMNILQLIGQSQILQQVYGAMLPKIVAHLAQLMGVRDMDQYSPDVQPGASNAGAGQPAGQVMPGADGAVQATAASPA